MAEKKVSRRKHPNIGGARPGAGRPPKDVELKLLQSLDKYIKPDEVGRRLLALMEGENVADKTKLEALKLYMNYRFGKPKVSQEVTVVSEVPLFNIDLSEDL